MGKTKDEVYEVIREATKDTKIKSILDEELLRKYSLFEHCVRVAVYSVYLCKRFKMEGTLILDVAKGALVHDVGKTLIPDNILYKNGRLTEEEFEVIKQHPEVGYEMMNGWLSETALDVIRYHHEKLDGSGYLHGITEIPLHVQFVTVADMYDAMTSKRSYKPSYTHARVMRNLYEDAEALKINTEIVDEMAKDPFVTEILENIWGDDEEYAELLKKVFRNNCG